MSSSSAYSLSVMCSACLNFAAFRAPARSPRSQACTAARCQKRTVGAVLGMVCYKCLLGYCRAHAKDAVDMVNVACSYVEEMLGECRC